MDIYLFLLVLCKFLLKIGDFEYYMQKKRLMRKMEERNSCGQRGRKEGTEGRRKGMKAKKGRERK